MGIEAVMWVGRLATAPAMMMAVAVGAVVLALRQRRRYLGERRRAARQHEELMAYMRLEDWYSGDARTMGKRLCRTISRHSAFGTAALLVRDANGRLRVAASMRTDDLTVSALERWAEAESRREVEPSTRRRAHLVRLERRAGYRPGNPAALAWCTALLVPMCTEQGVMVGALAVCADRFHGRPSAALEAAMRPLEALARRFAGSLEPVHVEPVLGSGTVAKSASRPEHERAVAAGTTRSGQVEDFDWPAVAAIHDRSAVPGGVVVMHRSEMRGGAGATGHA